MWKNRISLVVLALLILFCVVGATNPSKSGKWKKEIAPEADNKEEEELAGVVENAIQEGSDEPEEEGEQGTAPTTTTTTTSTTEETKPKLHKYDLVQLAASASWMVYDDTLNGNRMRIFLPKCYGPVLLKVTSSQEFVNGNDFFCATGHIYYPEKRRIILVALRGSESSVDWKVNQEGVFRKKKVVPGNEQAGHSSGGWVRAFRDLYKEYGAFLKADIKKYADEKPILLITGHSLGGVLASLLTAALTSKGSGDMFKDDPTLKHYGFDDWDIPVPEDTYLITFGSPQVGDETLVKHVEKALGCKEKIVRVVSRRNSFPKQDIVTRMQIFNRHICKPVLLKSGDLSIIENHRMFDSYGPVIFGREAVDFEHMGDPILSDKDFTGDKRFSSKVCQTTTEGYQTKGKDYRHYKRTKVLKECFRTFHRAVKKVDRYSYRSVVKAQGKCKRMSGSRSLFQKKGWKKAFLKGFCEAAEDCVKDEKDPCQGYCTCSASKGASGQCYCVGARPGGALTTWCRTLNYLKAQSNLKRIFGF